jgi:hypothetical protein
LVSNDARLALPVVWFADVDAPFGSGRAAAEIGSVVWSVAMATGIEVAMFF